MTIPVNYQKVRVKHLLREPKEYNGWNLNKRLPNPGEVGTLIDVLHAPGLPDHYVVEKTATDGSTTWLSEFLVEEIETIT